MDGPRGYHTKQSKPERERQVLLPSGTRRLASSWERWGSGSIPSPVQWVGDPALPQPWLRSDPWPRSSIYCGVAKKGRKRKERKRKGKEMKGKEKKRKKKSHAHLLPQRFSSYILSVTGFPENTPGTLYGDQNYPYSSFIQKSAPFIYFIY